MQNYTKSPTSATAPAHPCSLPRALSPRQPSHNAVPHDFRQLPTSAKNNQKAAERKRATPERRLSLLQIFNRQHLDIRRKKATFAENLPYFLINKTYETS